MTKAEATRCDARIKVEGYRRKRTVMEESNVWGSRIWKDGDGTLRGKADFRASSILAMRGL